MNFSTLLKTNGITDPEVFNGASKRLRKDFPNVDVNSLMFVKLLPCIGQQHRILFTESNVIYKLSYTYYSYDYFLTDFKWSIYSEKDEIKLEEEYLIQYARANPKLSQEDKDARERMRIYDSFQRHKRKVLELEKKLATAKTSLHKYASKHRFNAFED